MINHLEANKKKKAASLINIHIVSWDDQC